MCAQVTLGTVGTGPHVPCTFHYLLNGGHLIKLGGRWKSWRRRYFIAQKCESQYNALLYFRSQAEGIAFLKGKLKLAVDRQY